MTVSYASGRTLYLATKLTPAGTVTITSDPGPSNGRLYLANDTQVEWLEYTSKTLSGTNYILGWVTRDLDPVAIPSVSLSTGKTWLATQKCILVAMHDQLWDRQQGGPFASFTTAQLNARTNKQVGETFFDSTLGSLVYWNGTTYQSFGTGTFVNSSTTNSGGVETATTAESKAGTNTGSVWPLFVTPSDIAANTQSGTFVYATSTDLTDTYTANLTPALTSYTDGMEIRLDVTTANTGACTLNLNALGAKSIKLIDGTDPLDGDIAANSIVRLVYNGTNFILHWVAIRASDADASTGTNTLKFITPKQAKDNYGNNYISSTAFVASTTVPATANIAIINATLTDAWGRVTSWTIVLTRVGITSWGIAANVNTANISLSASWSWSTITGSSTATTTISWTVYFYSSF